VCNGVCIFHRFNCLLYLQISAQDRYNLRTVSVEEDSKSGKELRFVKNCIKVSSREKRLGKCVERGGFLLSRLRTEVEVVRVICRLYGERRVGGSPFTLRTAYCFNLLGLRRCAIGAFHDNFLYFCRLGLRRS